MLDWHYDCVFGIKNFIYFKNLFSFIQMKFKKHAMTLEKNKYDMLDNKK